MTLKIRELGIIGDQRTAALLDKSGSIVWYCPTQFDSPSLFAELLDKKKGGSWKISQPEIFFRKRNYLEDSGILETHLSSASGSFTLRDWMPISKKNIHGIVREIFTNQEALTMTLFPAPDYNRIPLNLQEVKSAICINEKFHLYASHPLVLKDDSILLTIPDNTKGWAFLSDEELPGINELIIEEWYRETEQKWEVLSSHITYHGIYEKEVADSIRAIRLLTFAENGGIIAAATTSLPEVRKGIRNYDYRYVWLRDSAMIVSALTRAGSDGVQERKFMDFICDTAHKIPGYMTKPLFSIRQSVVANETYLDLMGFEDSRPVRIGNNANDQLQLDSLGNVLLAAKLIYARFNTKEHWEIFREIANYLSEHWQKPDHGLWEENYKKQYTSSKVIVAVALEYISKYADSSDQKKYWIETANEIRKFIQRECMTKGGAYAVFAGSEDVDVSAVLFPIWAYTEADSQEMLNTIALLEKNYCIKNLYWRHLEDFDSSKEGAFLAGTFWVAEYWVMRNDFDKTKAILDAALHYSNDLGLFAEEADLNTEEMFGNFPQSFVHASFIGAVIDLKKAMEEKNVPFEYQNSSRSNNHNHY